MTLENYMAGTRRTNLLVCRRRTENCFPRLAPVSFEREAIDVCRERSKHKRHFLTQAPKASSSIICLLGGCSRPALKKLGMSRDRHRNNSVRCLKLPVPPNSRPNTKRKSLKVMKEFSHGAHPDDGFFRGL